MTCPQGSAGPVAGEGLQSTECTSTHCAHSWLHVPGWILVQKLLPVSHHFYVIPLDSLSWVQDEDSAGVTPAWEFNGRDAATGWCGNASDQSWMDS